MTLSSAVGEGDRDRHLAAQRRIGRLELVHFDDLLVWHELSEVAEVRVCVRARLPDPGRLA